MKLLFFHMCFLAFISNIYCQKKETLYIMDEAAYVNSDPHGGLHYLISIKSKNKSFDSDAYKFVTIQYIKKEKLEKFNPCDLHSFLSMKKNIFLIKPSDMGFHYYPINYQGTQKNLEMLKHGF